VLCVTYNGESLFYEQEASMKREGMQGLCGVKQKENVEKQKIEDCQYQDHGLENARGTYWEILNS
jgi:hypothetical protein